MGERIRTRARLSVAKRMALGLGATALSGITLATIYLWPPSEADISARRERIDAEISQLGSLHAWAGTYYRGDGLGCNNLLSIAPGEGYQFSNRGCLGLYDADHGSASFSEGHLVLRASVFSSPLQRREFVLIDWGSRRYLVEPGQLLDFVNAVNQHDRTDYCVGLLQDRLFYLRCGDEQKELEGKPALPPEYARLLLADRIAGHVTAVTGSRVDLDLGSDRGVFEGMELYMLGEGAKGFGIAVVSEVAAHTSVARVDSMDSFSPRVAVGWDAVSSLGD